MNSMWSAIIFNAVRVLVGSGIFDRTAILIRDLINTDIPGDDKKQQVIEFLQRERATLSSIVIDGIIFAVRLKYEQPRAA
jgi:hypothetical protein